MNNPGFELYLFRQKHYALCVKTRAGWYNVYTTRIGDDNERTKKLFEMAIMDAHIVGSMAPMIEY